MTTSFYMFRVVQLVFLFFVFSLCYGQFEYVSEESEARPEPIIELNSFEGSYTSNSLFSTSGLYLCVDKNNQISGSFDEAGIIQGFVISTFDDDENLDFSATGTFYVAGTGSCVTGNFLVELTSWGFSGTITCGGNSEERRFEETRTNVFRPTDDQCQVVDRVSSLTTGGGWETDLGRPIDGCLTDTHARFGYLREAENSKLGDPLVEGYIEGVNFLFGKVVTGTWYEEESAGPVILFVRNTGELKAFFWTGLVGDQGRSVIDRTEFRETEKHFISTWSDFLGPTTGSQCNRFAIVKRFLLDNLPEDDDDFYYFVNSDYFDAAVVPELYNDASPGSVQSSDSSSLVLSVLSIMIALLI